MNGFRAILKKEFPQQFIDFDADMLCLQETKMQEGQHDFEAEGYHAYYNYAEKKGYSGTAIFSKEEPLSVQYGIDIEEHDTEGRVITAEYEEFYLVNVYTPNSQQKLKRLDYRMSWEDSFREYLTELEATKPVILCGDLNVAHNEIDLANPDNNHKNPGFSDAEREQFSNLLAEGFIDTFRYFHPHEEDRYSWWSYRTAARTRNVGWRIDYFVVSESLEEYLKDADILDQEMGSDHCPVMLELKL